MVLVNMQVALGVNSEVYHAMLANLLQHVVEESQACRDVAMAIAVKVHLDVNVRFFSGALHLGSTLTPIGDVYGMLPGTFCGFGSV